MKQVNDWVYSMVHALMAPLIVFPGSFMDKEQSSRAATERLLHVEDCGTKKLATDYEVLLYLLSVTHCLPPDTLTYNCTAYMFRKVFGEKQADEIDLPNQPLDYQEKHMLDGLREWIYKKQIEHLKSKHK